MPPFLIYGVVALVLAVGGFGTGWKAASDHFKAEQLEAVNEAVAKVRADAVATNAVAEKLEEKKDAVRVVYRTIEKRINQIVKEPIYLNACLDDDGLRAANTALSGAAPDTGQPDAALPGPPAPAR